MCPLCSRRHDGSQPPEGTAGRRSWPYDEEVRARHEGQQSIPPEAVGSLPNQVTWSLYASKEAQRCARHTGSFWDFCDFLDKLGQRVLPSGDKRLAPFVSQPVIGDSRSRDANCESVQIVWFDSDGAGTWDTLRDVLRDSNVAAIFAYSTSRRPDHWHLGIPLAAPRAFGDANDPGRADYKAEYRHVTAVLSALAGFGGVGGKCGLDLCTDRLVQPMFPAMRRSEEDESARIELVLQGGALDWPAFLAATGFDLEASYKSEDRKVPRSRTGLSKPPVARGPYRGTLRPVGVALNAARMLGNAKDASGVHAACPFSNLHGGGRGEWDAIYFPASDTWWCPHSSCRGARSRESIVAALPRHAQNAYEAELANGFRPGEFEVDSNATAGKVTAWIEAQLARDLTDKESLLRATIGTVLRAGLSTDYAGMVAGSVEGERAGHDRARRTGLLLRQNAKVRGAGWLRKRLGAFALVELIEAIHTDTQIDPMILTRKIAGLGLVRGDDREWLWERHNALDIGDKIRPTLLRPALCRQGFDRAFANGELLGTIKKVCEDPACTCCFVLRLTTESYLLVNGWTQNGRIVEGWEDRGPFWIHRLAGIDRRELPGVLKGVSRFISHPRLRVHSMERDGKHTLLFVTNSNMAACLVRSELAHQSHGLENAVYSEEETDEFRKAIAAVMFARLRIYAHQRTLLEERRGDELEDWLRWRKGKHMVTRGKAALPWPPREAIRAESQSEESAFEIPEGADVSYTLVHAVSGTALHTQEYPHTVYDIGRYSRWNGRHHQALEHDEGYEAVAQELEDLAVREEAARRRQERVLAPMF